MLQKKNRLHKSRDFQKVFSKSKSIRGENLILKYFPNKFGSQRIGFIVSNKIVKRATSRNAIKRRLRAIIGESLERLPKSTDIILLLTREYPKPYKFDTIKSEVEGLIKKII
jgi:ribonuclease P protein component